MKKPNTNKEKSLTPVNVIPLITKDPNAKLKGG